MKETPTSMTTAPAGADIAPAFDVAGQIALVTGAARGIGRAVAIALAQAGADVALGFRDLHAAGDVADAIRALGRRVLPLQMDVARPAQISAAVAQAADHFGHLDILVNNAGIGPPNRAEAVTEGDFDATVAVNLKGTFFVSQAVGRAMIAGGRGGRIVNLSSQAGFVALPTESVYCMTKAAIAHLTKCLAVEWAAHGINVNAVAPTFIRTDSTKGWLEDDASLKSLLARIPLRQIGEPENVADPVVFLASAAAAMITGATLRIDGGWTAV
jgi:NAD(P)-dependent dehydrogenase (short-subunit alcohol dehydrogenase family)